MPGTSNYWTELVTFISHYDNERLRAAPSRFFSLFPTLRRSCLNLPTHRDSAIELFRLLTLQIAIAEAAQQESQWICEEFETTLHLLTRVQSVRELPIDAYTPGHLQSSKLLIAFKTIAVSFFDFQPTQSPPIATPARFIDHRIPLSAYPISKAAQVGHLADSKLDIDAIDDAVNAIANRPAENRPQSRKLDSEIQES